MAKPWARRVRWWLCSRRSSRLPARWEEGRGEVYFLCADACSWIHSRAHDGTCVDIVDGATAVHVDVWLMMPLLMLIKATASSDRLVLRQGKHFVCVCFFFVK